MRTLGCLFALAFVSAVAAQQPSEGTPGDAQKVVTLRRILVEGTRLPPLSVIRLAQIKAGDQVDFAKLHEAMQKVTATGLISKIDFEYESLPDKETDVVLHMKCTDVMPLAQGSIQIAKVNEDDVWNWLAQVDPLFTRELPPTEAAIRIYSYWIGKYMESHGVPMFQDNFAVVADASGKNVAEKLVFKVVKRRGRK